MCIHLDMVVLLEYFHKDMAGYLIRCIKEITILLPYGLKNRLMIWLIFHVQKAELNVKSAFKVFNIQ